MVLYPPPKIFDGQNYLVCPSDFRVFQPIVKQGKWIMDLTIHLSSNSSTNKFSRSVLEEAICNSSIIEASSLSPHHTTVAHLVSFFIRSNERTNKRTRHIPT